MMIERKSHIRKFLSAACAVMMVLLCGCSPKATDAKTVVTGTVNGLKYSWYEGIALFGPNFARGWYFHDEKILICDGMQGSGIVRHHILLAVASVHTWFEDFHLQFSDFCAFQPTDQFLRLA